MKRSAAANLLLRLRHHVLDGGAKIGVGERGIAALRRHRAFAFEHRLDERALALLDARSPGGLVAHLRRARDARLMAGRADRFHHFLAAPRACRAAATTGTAELDSAD